MSAQEIDRLPSNSGAGPISWAKPSHEYSAIVEAAALSSAERFKFLSLHQWMSILWMSCARATSDAPLLDEIDPEEVIADLKKYMEILT